MRLLDSIVGCTVLREGLTPTSYPEGEICPLSVLICEQGVCISRYDGGSDLAAQFRSCGTRWVQRLRLFLPWERLASRTG